MRLGGARQGVALERLRELGGRRALEEVAVGAEGEVGEQVVDRLLYRVGGDARGEAQEPRRLVHLGHHRLQSVDLGQALREQRVSERRAAQGRLQLDHRAEVLRLESRDGGLYGRPQVRVHPLGQQLREVDRAAEEVDAAGAEQRRVPVVP